MILMLGLLLSGRKGLCGTEIGGLWGVWICRIHFDETSSFSSLLRCLNMSICRF